MAVSPKLDQAVEKASGLSSTGDFKAHDAVLHYKGSLKSVDIVPRDPSHPIPSALIELLNMLGGSDDHATGVADDVDVGSGFRRRRAAHTWGSVLQLGLNVSILS